MSVMTEKSMHTVKLLIQAGSQIEAGSLIQAGGIGHLFKYKPGLQYKPGVQYKPGQSDVHLVPTYNTNSHFVWNNCDKTALLCHKISITKHTVSKVKVFVVFMQSRTLYT